METLDSKDPLAIAVSEAICTGDLPVLRRLLAENPGVATAYITRDCGKGVRSLLHIATDWPGHFPNGPQVVTVLVAAGADPNARFSGAHTETALHWAASSNDIPVLDTLIAAGADIEAPGAVIGGGTPLADACAFGQWDAARRLIEHGAHATFEEAATLGLLDQVQTYVASPGSRTHDEITHAFWGACHGGQLAMARYLFGHGADINWVGYDDKTPLDIALTQDAADVVQWLLSQGAKTRAQLLV